jgi:hypothetical protein
MADLAATNVTVALLPQDIDLSGVKTVTYPTIQFGDGLLTIPAGGIPLPDKGKFGMKREIKRLVPVGSGGSGYVFEYNAATHKLLAFMGNFDAMADGPLVEATGVAIAATTLPLIVIGD